MKRILLVIALSLLGIVSPIKGEAQVLEIGAVIQEGIKRVIRAVDLQVQRLQNETIWLQNAQKAIENTLSKLKLEEISGWVERQRTLYADYFDELHRVRSIIAYYRKIKSITERQVQIVEQYSRAYALFKQDDHFTPAEILYMGKVYTGIFDESLKNLDRLFVVIGSFTVTMTDAERLSVINEVSDAMDKNQMDLTRFNYENKLLSVQRSKSSQEVAVLKSLYGLE